MFRKFFNGYRNKSRQASKLKWVITTFMEKKAKHFADKLQSKSQLVPTCRMKWYLACFCALGLTISLLSVLAGDGPNKGAVTVKQMAIPRPKKFPLSIAGPNDFRNLQQAVQVEHYFDSLLQKARMNGQADSFIQHHRGLQDSIRLLKSLYHQE